MSLLDNKYPLDNPKYNFRLGKMELIIGTIAINLLSLALPIMVLQIYDRIMIQYSYDTMIILGIVVVAAILLEAFMRIVRSYATGWAGMLYEYSLDANAVRSYIHADPDRLKLEGVGKRVQNISAFSKLQSFHNGQALILMVDIPFAMIFIVLIYYIAGVLALVPLLLLSVFSAVNLNLGRDLLSALERQDEDEDNKYNFIIESLRGVHSVKSYGLEFLFKRKFEALEEKSSLSAYDSSLIHAKGMTYGVLFSEIMVVAMVAFGAPLVISNDLTTGGLVASTLLAGRLMQPVQKSLSLWDQYQEYKIAAQKADDLFAIPQVVRDPKQKSRPKEGKIELHKVKVVRNRKTLLEDVSLTLKGEEVIAVHAASNESKSALIKLLIGVKRPNEGEVLIDGIKAESFTSEDLVHHVALIEPDGIIFQGTILENLTGFDSAKEKIAKQLADLVDLHRHISVLPQGYETKISDGLTDVISPGVKQKISIVRVLLHNPKIIIFNNADKGLDSEGYKYLLNLLKKFVGSATMILFTEDSNFCALAKQHYALENKKLLKVKKSIKASSKLNIIEGGDDA